MTVNTKIHTRQALLDVLTSFTNTQSALFYVHDDFSKYTLLEMCDTLNIGRSVLDQFSMRGFSYNPLQYEILEDGTIHQEFVPFLKGKFNEFGIAENIQAETLDYVYGCFYLGSIQDHQFDLSMLYQWTNSTTKLKFDCLNAIKAYEDWMNNRIDQPYTMSMDTLNNEFLTTLQQKLKQLLTNDKEHLLLQLMVKLLMDHSLMYKRGYHKPEFEWIHEIVVVQVDLSSLEGRMLKELLDLSRKHDTKTFMLELS